MVRGQGANQFLGWRALVSQALGLSARRPASSLFLTALSIHRSYPFSSQTRRRAIYFPASPPASLWPAGLKLSRSIMSLRQGPCHTDREAPYCVTRPCPPSWISAGAPLSSPSVLQPYPPWISFCQGTSLSCSEPPGSWSPLLEPSHPVLWLNSYQVLRGARPDSEVFMCWNVSSRGAGAWKLRAAGVSWKGK